MEFLPHPGNGAAVTSLAARPWRMLFLLYWLWSASALAAAQCVPAVPAAAPVPAAARGEVSIATQNLMRLFDDIDDGGAEVLPSPRYRLRLDKLARQVGEVLRFPHVLAVQEAENQKVLAELAHRLAQGGAGPRYQVALLEGHDRGGIDVGFLVRADWKILKVEQLLARTRLDRRFLFDRPPLLLRLQTPQGPLDLVNVHLKSLRGSDRRAEAKRIARKRQRQAEALAGWVRARRPAGAGQAAPPLVVLGDFNAAPEVLGGVDVLGILQSAGLRSLHSRLPAGARWTYVYKCRGQALDHVLVSPELLPAVRRFAVSRGNAGVAWRHEREAGTPLRSADHDAVVLYLGP
ncbi:MAG: endonuclease/exonuclease/phosphatase family protein [Pseudomonadota bacterium]